MVELFCLWNELSLFCLSPAGLSHGTQNPAIFESRVPGLGLNIRGTVGTGTDISGTVPRSLCPGTENSRDCPVPIPASGDNYESLATKNRGEFCDNNDLCFQILHFRFVFVSIDYSEGIQKRLLFSN